MTAYQDAGVDVAAGEDLVDRIKAAVKSTWRGKTEGEFGGFAGGIAIPDGYNTPVILMSTDGCGTKAEVARQAGLFDGLGHDLVASCVDDLAAAGARPLALTDYLTVGKLNVAWAAKLIESIAGACNEAGVALLGGETAEHPGVMDPDEFDLAGTAIGVMEAGTGPDSSLIQPGDLVLGLPSPNVRANGFSLVRSRVIPRVGLSTDVGGQTLGELLLEPSVIYSPAVASIREKIGCEGHGPHNRRWHWRKPQASAAGGVNAVLDSSTWDLPAVFELIEAEGGISRDDMYQTFNMGLGFVLIVSESEVIEEGMLGLRQVGTIHRGFWS